MITNDSDSIRLYNNGIITKEELINTPYRDSCIIPSITPQEIPQNPQIPNIPVKISRMGWICSNCGSSNSPDILFCPKCSNANYSDFPIHDPSPIFTIEPNIIVTCESNNDNPKTIL